MYGREEWSVPFFRQWYCQHHDAMATKLAAINSSYVCHQSCTVDAIDINKRAKQ